MRSGSLTFIWLVLANIGGAVAAENATLWSLVTPQRPRPPAVDRADWVRTPIDRFVLARIEAEGLKPLAEADRRTLIRRVTFDLTGLPPRLEDVRAFELDNSPHAYEKLIDRLIASDAFGEHMARYWLDLVRYADTHGLHFDNYREIWPYRDWVIRAFNQNMPFDQFAMEQLAGDLMPDATVEQQIATGFNRCHVSTNEGGSIEEEVYVRNVVDRVSAVGTVYLGLTLGCAVCHDHKYDPITQRDFYQLFAFFNSLDGPALDGNVKDTAPSVRVPTHQQTATLLDLDRRLKLARAPLERMQQEQLPAFDTWLASRTGQPEIDPPRPRDDHLLVHCNFDELRDGAVADVSDVGHVGELVGAPSTFASPFGRAMLLTADSYLDLGNIADFKKEDKFSFTCWVRAAAQSNGALIAKLDRRRLDRGYSIYVDGGRVHARINNRRPGYEIAIKTRDLVFAAQAWHHLAVTYDGSAQASGLTIYVDGRRQEIDVRADSLGPTRSIDTPKPLQIGREDDRLPMKDLALGDLRIYGRELSAADVQLRSVAGRVRNLSTTDSAPPSDKQLVQLREYFLLQHHAPYAKALTDVARLEKEKRALEASVPTSLVFRERSQPREAFVLVRGQYDQRGAKVERRTPGFLPPLPSDAPRNRLGLAQWLFAPGSVTAGLTSRVAVNRFWQQFFGTGLVQTAEDFGTRGAAPSHPKLLDWLATDFVHRGWNVNALLKQIVMSATYRQSSRATPAVFVRDPNNRLLARGPRFRLDAEMLRDQALAVSGLLVHQLGGPSVKPPQPDGLWRAVGFSGSNTMQFQADTGRDKVHRRSLYTFWKRTSPPPQMSTFDAPSREACAARRERTNSPLQALLLLNDPQYVEAARHLGKRIARRQVASDVEKAAWAFEHVTGRGANTVELDELMALAVDLEQAYRDDPASAAELLAAPESPPTMDTVQRATWTVFANLLLNLDEVLTKQ